MLDGEIDHYRKVVATDLDSTFYCARAAGRVWRRQKEQGTDIYGRTLKDYRYGSFIATASMSGHVVNIPQLQAAYNGAKAGIIHLGEGSLTALRSKSEADVIQFARSLLNGSGSRELTVCLRATWPLIYLTSCL